MKKPRAPGEQKYDRIRSVHAYKKPLLIERDDDGNWTERIEDSAISSLDPVDQPKQTTSEKRWAVPAASQYLRLDEAARYSRAGKKRLLRWVRRGLLPEIVDPDGRRFFKREDLDAVMEGGPVAEGPISSATVLRTKASRNNESWLRPVFPRTKPRDPEGR